jgi:hypothetical protein
MSATSLSQNFVLHLQALYEIGLNELARPDTLREGVNCPATFAAPAYISAVAAVESFLNEMIFGLPMKNLIVDSPLWDLNQEWVEKLEIGPKLIILPYLLFNKSLRRDQQPFQDMSTLIKIRNDLIHYKMGDNPPGYFRDLQAKKIALSIEPDTALTWTDRLCSLEGIRWANNTACKTVHSIFNLVPEGVNQMFFGLASNFREIPEEIAKTRIKSL